MPSVVHCHDRYANNRAEVSHQHTRKQGRQMRRFKSMKHAQCFLSAHRVVNNLFRLGCHLVRACHYQMFRDNALGHAISAKPLNQAFLWDIWYLCRNGPFYQQRLKEGGVIGLRPELSSVHPHAATACS